MTSTRIDEQAGALGRRWASCYNEYLFLILALRHLVRSGCRQGLIADKLVACAERFAELTDQLEVLGFRPTRRFAGVERELWVQTSLLSSSVPLQGPADALGSMQTMLDDAKQLQDAWEKFEAYALSLSDDFFCGVPALDPRMLRRRGLEHLLGSRRLHPECV